MYGLCKGRYSPGMRRFITFTLAVFMAAASLSSPTQAGDDDEGTHEHEHDDEHDRVRRARERGDILPLMDILKRVEQAYPGQVIETEYDDEHGRMVYELVVLGDDGRVLKLYYDAGTGELLKVKGRKEHK